METTEYFEARPYYNNNNDNKTSPTQQNSLNN